MFTVIDWIDVFIHDESLLVLLNSIQYWQQHKGLEVYAWCIMPSHIHLIAGTTGNKIESIIRDVKSYTSRHIRKVMEDPNQVHESRRELILKRMYIAGKFNNNNDYQFWQQDSHPRRLRQFGSVDIVN